MWTVTYKTRWCPRMYPDVPYMYSKHKNCRCIDCWRIRLYRQIRRWWQS